MSAPDTPEAAAARGWLDRARGLWDDVRIALGWPMAPVEPDGTPATHFWEWVAYKNHPAVAGRPLSQREWQAAWRRPPAFGNHLPWIEYDPGPGAFLLADWRSWGALFELHPVDTVARPDEWLNELHAKLTRAFAAAVPEEDGEPWVVQIYVYDEPPGALLHRAREYAGANAQSAFAAHWFGELERHMTRISGPQGAFRDPDTGTRWRCKLRRVRLAVSRRVSRPTGAEEALNQVCYRLEQGLRQAGVRLERLDGKALYEWLVPWFSPRPTWAGGDAWKQLDIARYPGDPATDAEVARLGHDLSELVAPCHPQSTLGPDTWWFDGLPHRFLTVQAVRQPPQIGHFTGERPIGGEVCALFDRLPEHSVLAITIQIVPQDFIKQRLEELIKSCMGDDPDSRITRTQAEAASEQIALGNSLYPTTMGVYLRGETGEQLDAACESTIALLAAHGLDLIRPQYDLTGLDTYLRMLPHNFEVPADKHSRRSRLLHADHIAALAPVYGRSTGTGKPGVVAFNRGGEPFLFDPFRDRINNAFGLIVGPPGSGKSALLNYLAMHWMAVHRPRLFIIEKGGSFNLLGQHFEAQGLKVVRITIKPGSDVSLPPFADAMKLLDQEERTRLAIDQVLDLEADTDDEASERDLLAELEIATRLMITGGEEKEEARLMRADSQIIREAILLAARGVRAVGGEQVLVEDVANALDALGMDESRPTELRDNARKNAAAMRLFTDGLAGRLFNRPGSAPWPDADVTILDVGILAGEGYQAELAVAYIGLMNRIVAMAEARQYERRMSIVATDEAHVITRNPLLAPYLVGVVKMARKLGLWAWFATQNMADFPDAAARILNALEWWLCLAMPPDEIEQLARFRTLNDEQKAMLLSVQKRPGLYTEGVLLSKATQPALFRNVVPPLALAFAMTEKEEKAARRAVMDELGCSELEAAYEIARRMEAQATPGTTSGTRRAAA